MRGSGYGQRNGPGGGGMTSIHDGQEIRQQEARRERLERHARLMLVPGYDPVWGLLKPPSSGPDPRDFPQGFVASARSGGRARQRSYVKGRPRAAGGHES